MAKKKASKKKAAKKSTTRKKKTFASDGPLPPKQRDKVLRKLKKLSMRPSHPSSSTGPAIPLNFDAPMPKKRSAKKAKKDSAKRTKKKK